MRDRTLAQRERAEWEREGIKLPTPPEQIITPWFDHFHKITQGLKTAVADITARRAALLQQMHTKYEAGSFNFEPAWQSACKTPDVDPDDLLPATEERLAYMRELLPALTSAAEEAEALNVEALARKEAEREASLSNAREAIAQGIDREAVLQELRVNGIDPTELEDANRLNKLLRLPMNVADKRDASAMLCVIKAVCALDSLLSERR